MANIINVIVNYVLIFGKFGFPEMGLIGAGIGTLVSRIVMPLMFIIYIITIPRFKRYISDRMCATGIKKQSSYCVKNRNSNWISD